MNNSTIKNEERCKIWALWIIYSTWQIKRIKKFNKTVDIIDSLEPKFESMADSELKNMTNIFKERLANGESIDDILPEAFAVVREVSKSVRT